MRRTLAWIAGLAGIAALGHYVSRRRRGAASPAAGDPTPDPAEQLRARLSEQREHDPDETMPGEGETIDERRAHIHAKANTAIGEMREPSS